MLRDRCRASREVITRLLGKSFPVILHVGSTTWARNKSMQIEMSNTDFCHSKVSLHPMLFRNAQPYWLNT